MNPIRSKMLYAAAVSIGFAFPLSSVLAAEPAPATMSASELAGRLNSARQAGSSLVRLKMEVKGTGTVLQLQVKERHSGDSGESVYQVLWPKERKGESVLLRRSGRSISGSTFTPPDTVRAIGASQAREPFFGSDVSYEDLVENFFAWDQQEIVGTEEVNNVNCYILESKPGKGRSSYGKVRSWIDPKRLVPLRVEKYSSAGKVVRRIDTTRVVSDGRNRYIPANLRISGPGGGSVTEIDGSRIKHGVAFEDREFTPEGLREISAPRGGAPE